MKAENICVMTDSDPIARSPTLSQAPGSPWRTWCVLVIVSFGLYACTANRGAQWQDSGIHLLRVVTHEAVNPLGLALSHPLHHWLSRTAVAFDVLEPSFVMTLVSGLAAAIAVANVFGCVLTLTRCRAAALMSAISLGMAHTFWQTATIIESTPLTAALLSAECWCLIAFARKPGRHLVWLMLLFNGLGFANHNFALLTVPVLAVVTFAGVRGGVLTLRDVGIGVVFWVLGSIPYTAMIASELGRSEAWAATLQSAFFGNTFRGSVLNATVSVRSLSICAAFVLLNFPNLMLAAAGRGLTTWKRGDVPLLARRALLAGLVIHFVFAVRYSVVDQYMFFLPTYVFLAMFGGIGFAFAWRSSSFRAVAFRRAAVVLLATTPIVYWFVPDVARSRNVLSRVERHKPYRDDYVYLFTPWRVVERSAERMSLHALQLVRGRGVIIVADSMAEPAVRYQVVQAGADDVSVVSRVGNEKVHAAAKRGEAVVFVPANVTIPPPDLPFGAWRREGDLYVLSVAGAEES